MSYMPLNPYERYEITGMSDEEREAERFASVERKWDEYEYEDDLDVDDLVNELMEVFEDG